MAGRRFAPDAQEPTESRDLQKRQNQQNERLDQAENNLYGDDNPWVEEGYFAYRFKQRQLGFVGLDARVFLAVLTLVCFFALVVTMAVKPSYGFALAIILCLLIFGREKHARQVSFGAFSLLIWLVCGGVARLLGKLVLSWRMQVEVQRLNPDWHVLAEVGQNPGFSGWNAYLLADGLQLLWLALLCWQFFVAWQGKVLYLPFARAWFYLLYKKMRPGLAWE